MCLGRAGHSMVPRTAHKNRLYRSVRENKRCWDFYKLCYPKDVLARGPFESEKYCGHPHAGRGRWRGTCVKGVFSGGIPACSQAVRAMVKRS